MTHSINLQAIASRYGGKVCGDTALIPTPGHSAKDRGTSIKLDRTAPDGCLVHCHNGSRSDALAVKDMLRRDGFLPERTSTFVGPDVPDLSALLAPKMGDEGAFEPAFSWDYYDAAGTLCYRKHRTDLADGSKTFRFEHRDKNGQWANGLGNSAHHLYRLPHLTESTGPIFVAEGERCADYLVHWGFEATSSKDLTKADLGVFKGRTAIVLPDNDTPGRQCADEAHKAILAAGGMPTIVELPNLPEKGDILDWDGTREDLVALLAASQKTIRPSIEASPFVWRNPSEIPTRPWLFGRWLLQGMLGCLIAPGGSGKSTFVSALALSVASGENFLGQEVHGGASNVWVWNLEDDLDELSRSILATAKHHELDVEQLEGRLFVDSALDGSTLCTATEGPDGMRILQPVYDALRQELIRREISLLILDPFVSSHEVEENSNTKIDKVAKEWARVAKAANCCILLVHHTSKGGSGDVNAMSARGAVALINAARSALVINRLAPEKAGRYGIEPFEAARYICVSDDKHNRAPAGSTDWFRIASVDLGNDLQINLGEISPYGIQGDSVGVVVPHQLSEAVDELSPEHIKALQGQIATGSYARVSPQANQWAGHALAKLLELDVKSDRQRLSRTLTRLVEQGYLERNEVKDGKGQDRPIFTVGSSPMNSDTPTSE